MIMEFLKDYDDSVNYNYNRSDNFQDFWKVKTHLHLSINHKHFANCRQTRLRMETRLQSQLNNKWIVGWDVQQNQDIFPKYSN